MVTRFMKSHWICASGSCPPSQNHWLLLHLLTIAVDVKLIPTIKLMLDPKSDHTNSSLIDCRRKDNKILPNFRFYHWKTNPSDKYTRLAPCIRKICNIIVYNFG